MKKSSFILIFYFLTTSCFGQKGKQDYRLSWDGESSILEVKLSYTPTSKDSTVFEYGDPRFGGQSDIFKVVKNIHSDLPDKIKINEDARQITVYHKGSGLKKLYYDIDGETPKDKKPSIFTELFRPVITKDFLNLVNNFFMMNSLDTNDVAVSIAWDKFPKDFVYFNSIDPKKGTDKKLVTTKKVLDQRILFVMGKEISVNQYDVHGIPYYSISSTNKGDLKTTLPPFFKDFFPAIRDFWKDNEGLFYYVSVLPLQYSDKNTSGGFGMENGFLMKYLGNFGFAEKAILAHETSHYWVGGKVVLGEDSFDNQWFGEGFNDYVTLINLAKSKVFSKTEFVDFLNKNNFEEHYTSPVKDSSNASIAINYWTDYGNYGRLPYRRGLIYAFYLDNQIRLASEGKFTLRDVLLDMFALGKSKKSGEITTVEDFINIVAKYIPKQQIKDEIENYMIKGKAIDFHKVKLIPAFELYFKDKIPQIKLSQDTDLEKIFHW